MIEDAAEDLRARRLVFVLRALALFAFLCVLLCDLLCDLFFAVFLCDLLCAFFLRFTIFSSLWSQSDGALFCALPSFSLFRKPSSALQRGIPLSTSALQFLIY